MLKPPSRSLEKQLNFMAVQRQRLIAVICPGLVAACIPCASTGPPKASVGGPVMAAGYLPFSQGHPAEEDRARDHCLTM